MAVSRRRAYTNISDAIKKLKIHYIFALTLGN